MDELERRLREALAEEYAAEEHPDEPGECEECMDLARDVLPTVLRALERAGLRLEEGR